MTVQIPKVKIVQRILQRHSSISHDHEIPDGDHPKSNKKNIAEAPKNQL